MRTNNIISLVILFCASALAAGQNYQTPPQDDVGPRRAEKQTLIRVSFFINDREVPLTGDHSFSLYVGDNEVRPASVSDSGYVFPAISGREYFSVAFKKGTHRLKFDRLSTLLLKDDVEMAFAIIDDLDLLKINPPSGEGPEGKRAAYYSGRGTISGERFIKSLGERSEIRSLAVLVVAPSGDGDYNFLLNFRINREE